MSFFLPPLCCHLIFGSKALAGPSYLHFKICIFHIDLSATGFNIGDVSHDTFCFIMHYEFLLLSPSSSQIPVPTPRLMRPSVLSGGGEIYHFNLISINKIISLLLEVTAANAILSSSDWNLRGGDWSWGWGDWGWWEWGSTSLHFTSITGVTDAEFGLLEEICGGSEEVQWWPCSCSLNAPHYKHMKTHLKRHWRHKNECARKQDRPSERHLLF